MRLFFFTQCRRLAPRRSNLSRVSAKALNSNWFPLSGISVPGLLFLLRRISFNLRLLTVFALHWVGTGEIENGEVEIREIEIGEVEIGEIEIRDFFLTLKSHKLQ